MFKKLKAIIFIWKETRHDKKPFNKKMKRWLTWHKPFEPSYEIDGSSFCPSCGDVNIKDNGQGFFRCRTKKCGKRFIILECTEYKEEKRIETRENN